MSKKILSGIITICLIVAALPLAWVNVSAEEAETVQYGLGALENDEDIEYIIDYDASNQSQETDGDNNSDTGNLPSSVDLSQSNAFPCVGDQGSVGSCVSWATGWLSCGCSE